MYTKTLKTPLGNILLAANEHGLTGLWFENQKYFGASLTSDAYEKAMPVFDETERWLEAYFSGKCPRTMPVLAPVGGEFRQMIWQLLCEIPYGTVATYKDIAAAVAQKLGRPSMSAQAVGGAIAHNPISILIPCHRVVGTNGSLTGYAGGIERKIRLLELENVDVRRFFVP